MAAAAAELDVNDLPPGPFPSDDTKPCPIAWLPPDLWYHISQFVATDQSSDFVVTTAQTVDNTSSMPLKAFREDADLTLRGVPANGVLYITEVPEESEELREVFNDRTQTMVPDLGPWFAKIHRHHGGEVDLDRTPSIPHGVGAAQHSFYVEATASHAVRLHVSDAEYDVIKEWHDFEELRPASSRETQAMRNRLTARKASMLDDTNLRFLKVSGGSTKACNGQLTVLALCKAMKIKAKLSILGTLPLMARLDLKNRDDELSRMTHPYNLKPQMSYNLGKWLVLVPAKWILCTQMNLLPRVLTAEELGPSRVIPDVDRLRAWVQAFPDIAPQPNNSNRFLNRTQMAPPFQGAFPGSLNYSDTSFKTIAPLMVYAFFSCANRFVSLTSDVETWRLINRAKTDDAFRNEFSITGPHVTAAGSNEHLTVSKAGAAVPAHISPEMDLVGGFDGVL